MGKPARGRRQGKGKRKRYEMMDGEIGPCLATARDCLSTRKQEQSSPRLLNANPCLLLASITEFPPLPSPPPTAAPLLAMAPSYSGSLQNKNKTELKAIAGALHLSLDGTKDELSGRIKRHLDSNQPKLEDNPMFAGLYGRRRRSSEKPPSQIVERPALPPYVPPLNWQIRPDCCF